MPRPVSIPDTEVHPLHSKHVADDFELWIARPQAGFVATEPGPVRVLYVLDANLFFGTVVEMTRLMHKLYGELPPLLVVGVAYPTEDGLLQGALRTRDFTPSEDAGMAAMASSFPQSPEAARIRPTMGGAEAFRRFLEEEAKPFVDERFDVQHDGQILFGSSLGGLFVLHTLWTTPDAFDTYLAVSPALWWNDDEAFRTVESRVTALDRRPGVFIAVGELEEAPEVPMLARFRMVTNARAMATRLQDDAIADLQVDFEEFAGESHTSVVPGALTRGLRTFLRTPRPDA